MDSIEKKTLINSVENAVQKLVDASNEEISKRGEMIMRLTEITSFKQGWNGYNALPIPIEAIRPAFIMVRSINPVPTVTPTARQSIQLEWEINGICMELEIFADRIEWLTKYNK